MSPRRSLIDPLTSLAPRWDVIVIGSGYGGGIAAARFARAGLSVCVLERGREWLPSELPRGPSDVRATVQVRVDADGRSFRMGSREALFDFRLADGVSALVGSGVGGTSLVNANVLLEPDKRVWDDPVWPEAIRTDLEGRARALEAARAVLEPEVHPGRLAKLDLLERIGRSVGGTVTRAPLMVALRDGESSGGVPLAACNGCGNCASGCVYGARKGVDATYLALAKRSGAKIFAGIEVSHVAQVVRGEAPEWRVHYRLPSRPIGGAADGQGDDHALPFVIAPVVVLAAGSFGSTEILLRSRERGLPLSDALGSSFSANGNAMGAIHDPAGAIGGLGVDDPSASGEPGPCIAGVVEVGGESLEASLNIEDGTIPRPLEWLAGARASIERLGSMSSGARGLAGFAARAREVLAGVAERAVGARAPFLLLLAQGHDGARGRLVLGASGVRVDWPRYEDDAPARRIDEVLAKAAKDVGGRYQRISGRLLFGGEHMTVHPLGGCPMGAHAGVGVVDHRCAVFDPRGPSGAVHPGLFVCDGSVIPRSVGKNPVAVIATLAERAVALAIDDVRSRPLQAPAAAISSAPSLLRAPGPGFAVSEAFDGWLARSRARDRRGAGLLASPLHAHLSIRIEDWEEFRSDARHPASVTGTIRTSLLSNEPLSVVRGKVFLLTDDDEREDAFYNLYELGLVSTDGAEYVVTGMKVWQEGEPLGMWGDGTQMPIEVFEGERPEGSAIAHGFLRMSPRQFLGSVRSYRGTRAPTLAGQWNAQTRFYGFSMRRLAERLARR